MMPAKRAHGDTPAKRPGYRNSKRDAYWLLPEPVVDGVLVDGAGFGACDDIGAAGAFGGAEPVVAAGGAGTLLAVVSLT